MNRYILPFLLLMLVFDHYSINAQINVQYYINKGLNEYSNQQYPQAIQTLNVLIRSKPDLPLPYVYRGLAKFNLGDYRGADFDFTRAIMLDPYDPDPYHFRGAAKSNMLDYHSALDDFRKSIERGPNNPYVFRSRGITQMKMENFTAAIISFDTAIILNPGDEDFYYLRAVNKSRLKDFTGAVNDCNRAIKLNRFYKEAFLERGKNRNELGDIEGAMSDFDQVIKLDETNALVYYYRGFTRIKSGDTIAALNDYSKVIELDPSNDLTYYNRSMIMLALGDYEKALDDLNQVININPENIYTLYNRGDIKFRLGDYEGAAADFTKAIDLFPDFAAAYLRRSSVRYELKDDRGAKEDYDMAIYIINAVNSGEDFGLINKRYSADSTYLQKLIEFEADFNSDDVSGGRIQNRQVLVQLLPNFSIQYYDSASMIALQLEKNFKYRDLERSGLSIQGYSLAITTKNQTIKDSEIQYLQGKVDSVLYYDPFNAHNYFTQGMLDAMLMNFSEAKIAYDRAIELDPAFLEAIFNRSEISFEIAEHQYSIEEAIPRITINIDGKAGEPVDQPHKTPDFGAVIADLNRVVQLDYNMFYAYYNRGNIKNRLRDFEGAVRDYTVALAIEPNFAEALYNRAITLIYLKRNEEACLDLSKAGELGIQEAYAVIKRYCNK